MAATRAEKRKATASRASPFLRTVGSVGAIAAEHACIEEENRKEREGPAGAPSLGRADKRL